MTTFLHSGKYGDAIFSLPTIKEMGGGVLYLPDNPPEGGNMYQDMKAFLETQSYIHSVELYRQPNEGYWFEKINGIDVNLNRHRLHPLRGATNMVQRYFDVFDIHEPVPLKWIEAETSEEGYTLVNLTNRFRGTVNWHRVLNSITGPLLFAGTNEEWRMYQALQPRKTERVRCDNVLQLCWVVANADSVYCNQSLCLALAMGLNKKRYVEFKPLKTNCKTYTPNEYELL